MGGNDDINRLTAEELAYEMRIRGIHEVTVDEMRKSLRAARKRERQGEEVLLARYPYTFEEDREALQGKMEEITGLISEFRGDDKSSAYLKINTKLEWALRRIMHCQREKDNEIALASEIRGKLYVLLGDLEEKADAVSKPGGSEESAARRPRLVESNEREEQGSEAEDIADRTCIEQIPNGGQTTGGVSQDRARLEGRSGPEVVPMHPICDDYRFIVPVSKWNLQFTGERNQSVSSFLERVEELRQARGLGKDLLFRSAVDLFAGNALIWFRAVRDRVHDWNGLVKELRMEFLGVDYDDQLLDEIKRRTQGKKESIGMYVAIMKGLFGRMLRGSQKTKCCE